MLSLRTFRFDAFYYVKSAPGRSYRYLAAARKYPSCGCWRAAGAPTHARFAAEESRVRASGNGLRAETTPPGVAILKFLETF